MQSYGIKALLEKGKDLLLQEVVVNGWVRSFRSNRFIALNDGSTINNIQIVVNFENFDESIIKQISTAASLRIKGEVVESEGAGQDIEIVAKEIKILGTAPSEELKGTILQPKQHSLEILREQAHLRFRTNMFGAIMRVRNSLMFGIHKYFNENGFVYINTPIVTGSDAEGAGEMFHVTNLDLENLPKNEEGKVDYTQDFFGKATNLTVSGQLEGETAAMGLGKIYTFGPTFRAENSNTSRHLAEFWMIEPEIAFFNLDQNMDLAEDFMKYVISYAMENCKDDLKFLAERFDKEQKQNQKQNVQN